MKKTVLFDLEYTSWKGSQKRRWGGPHEQRRIIQIGAIKINERLEEISSFTTIIQPGIRLSEYVQSLTGITQKDVDGKGISFRKALKSFLEFIDGDTAWSYGVDMMIIGENIAYEGCEELLPTTSFQSIRTYLQNSYPKLESVVSGDLANACGITLDGHKHNALYDVRSILHCIRYLQETNKAELSEVLFSL